MLRRAKHSRILGQRPEGRCPNYTQAICVTWHMRLWHFTYWRLEACLLQSVGTPDDLEAFANASRLFYKSRFITSAKINGIVEDAFK